MGKNPPNQGKWSLPGGKIELGEKVLEAAKREIQEETNLMPSDCDWYHGGAFMTTDAIFDDNGTLTFHYVIAQCFARTKESLPVIQPNDDALNAKWWTLSEIEAELEPHNLISNGVLKVINRANELS